MLSIKVHSGRCFWLSTQWAQCLDKMTVRDHVGHKNAISLNEYGELQAGVRGQSKSP